ncbi:MAG: hypothetical protein ABIH48_00560 [Candidatus Falkowbacteria bacterium]
MKNNKNMNLTIHPSNQSFALNGVKENSILVSLLLLSLLLGRNFLGGLNRV